jgi:transcriptional regulator GlxA family with amidase domain
MCLYHSSQSALTKLTAEQVVLKAQGDWDTLLKATGLNHDDLVLALHVLLREVGERMNTPLTSMMSRTLGREDFELIFQQHVDKLFGDRILKERIASARDSLQDSNLATALKSAYGFETWALIHEKLPNPTTTDLFWQVRLPLTFSEFVRVFDSRRMCI